MNNNSHKKYIKDLAIRGGLSHAWLLISSGNSKEETAVYLASAMLCVNNGINTHNIPCETCPNCRKVSRDIHPDLIRVRRLPDKKEILVDQVRETAKEAYVLPNEARRKVFIVEEADTLNANAQNAMLKLLEEPPAYASFILLSDNPGNLLETVRSRCVELYIPEGNEEPQYSELAIELVTALAVKDGLSLVKACAKAEKADKETFDRLMDEMFAVSANMAKEALEHEKRTRCMELSVLADRLRQMRVYNVGSGHCLGLIMSSL